MNVMRHPRPGSGGRSTTYTDIFGVSSLGAGTRVDNGRPMNVRALALKRPRCARTLFRRVLTRGSTSPGATRQVLY